MTRCRIWLSLLVVPALTLMLAGCGQNIFQGLAGESEKSADSLLESGDFSGAIEKADEIISTTQTGEVLQEALSIKATALMGQSRSLPKNALQAISTLSNDSQNILSTLDETFPISPSNSVLTADLLNYADSLGSSTNIIVVPDGFGTGSPISNTSLSPSLDATSQFRRGFANMTASIKLVTQYLTISPGTISTTVTLNSTAIDAGIDQEDVIRYLTNQPKSLSHYSENSVDGFEESNALTQDQILSVRKIKAVGANFDQLRSILDSSNSGTFTAVDYQNQSSGLTPIVFSSSDTTEIRESKYLEAFNQIINAAVGGAE